MIKLIVASLALLLLTTLSAGAEPKGRAACQSLKTVIICNGRSDCAWVVEQKGKSKGPVGKCVPLKATPH